MNASGRTRRDIVDIARAAALIAMVVYHLIWDLADYGFLSPGAPFTPPMRLASNAIASAFLALVGVSMVLAHRAGATRRGVARRIVLLAAAAGLVSAATLVAEPQAPILFGILHCIALASLLAAPMLRLPATVACIAGVVALAAPRLLASDAFDAPVVQWLGLGVSPPATLDWRPLLPWAGVVWLALGAARWLPDRFWQSPAMRWRAQSAGPLALAWLGRHSLAVYLAHQPILFAVLFVASGALGLGARQEREAFLAACRPACVESGGAIEACEQSCACVADKQIRAARLASIISQFWPDAGHSAVQSCVTP